jgi:hypothetical protein
MAEVFAIATGALSVAGFSGQLAQSTAFLYDFIKDIKNAPKTVRDISEQLRILTHILLEIPKSYGKTDPNLRDALQHCGRRIDELVAFVKLVDPTHYNQKRKRLWSQCKAALKRTDLGKQLAGLERCISILNLVCNNLPR